MAELVVTSSTSADATFSAAGATAWNTGMTATSGQLSAARGGTGLDNSAATGILVWAAGVATAATGIAQSGGAITTISGTTLTATTQHLAPAGDVTTPGYGFTGSTNFGLYKGTSDSMGFTVGGTERFQFWDDGSFYVGGGGAGIAFASGSVTLGPDSGMVRAGPNTLVFNAGSTNPTSRSATSRTEINKAITGIADATPTATFTVTIPNAAHSASIRVRLTGSLGAGGAIGANESTQDAEYMINIARTAGVNAVPTIGAVVGQAAAASVAGANNAAVTATLGAVAGAVGATNTFTVNVTITKSGGASAAHTCLAFAELLNANTSGITIA